MKVSIILPTYNRASSYLKEAIDSVINQSYMNWELIVIDNNSTDNTIDLVKSYKSNKIFIYQINNNGVIAKSRNLGIEKSSGDYVAFLDSDDFWYKNKLQKCVDQIKSDNFLIICHAEKWLYSNGSINKTYGPKNMFQYKKMLSLGSSTVSTSAVIIKKDLLKEAGLFREDDKIITAEDYDMWLNVSKINDNITFINQPLGAFRIHDKSESNDIIFNAQSTINVLNQHFKKTNLLDPATKELAISRVWLNAAKSLQIKGEYLSSFDAYKKANKIRFSIKIILFMATLLIPYKFFKTLYYSLK